MIIPSLVVYVFSIRHLGLDDYMIYWELIEGDLAVVDSVKQVILYKITSNSKTSSSEC